MPETKPREMTPWNNDSSIAGTQQDLVYTLKQRYGITRAYVTIEYASNRLLSFLEANFKVKSAGYTDMTEPENADVVDHSYSFLTILDPRLDAFYFNMGGCNRMVVIFFDDPAELLKIHESAQVEFPPGAYQLQETMTGYAMLPMPIGDVEKPILEPGLMESLISDTDTFFNSRDFYMANKLNHKRGILILGQPGVGKTTFNKYYLAQQRDKYGVVLDCAKMYFGPSLFHFIKGNLGNKPKILALEDVDGATESSGSRSSFLNFIDGPNELSNTLFLATTNYPERLDAAILDRPSRFDAVYYMGLPNLELRKEFLIKWFPNLAGERQRLMSLAEQTEGFSGAYFKELFTLTGLRQCSVEDALKALHDRQQMLKEFATGIPTTSSDLQPIMDGASEPGLDYSKAMADDVSMAASKKTGLSIFARKGLSLFASGGMPDYRVDHAMALKIIGAK